MAGVRGNVATPGEFRRSRNWIGQAGSTPATAAYIPPPPVDMTACLDHLERFLHETVLPPLVQVALVHYQFEAIRREYYEGLQGVTERGEWADGWAIF